MPVKKILVVDDSPTDRAYLVDMLTQAGYQIVTAENGEEGINKAKSEKPDLVMMDVVMPGMNGFQACRGITSGPETKDIPVFLCTTKSQETDKVWGMRQGAKEYLIKPANKDDLLAKIKALG